MLFETGLIMLFCIIIGSKIIKSSFQMPHPRAKGSHANASLLESSRQANALGGRGDDFNKVFNSVCRAFFTVYW